MRAMWKGSVSFGLVTIPIQLYAATENKNVSLRQVHETDGARIQYKRFCSAEDKEVPYNDIAKGYELDDGQMVVLTDDDLADLPLSSSHSIEVLEFVDLEAIDPIYFDRSYYLEPQQAATKPYVLLRDALHKSGHVAIAKVALRQREALAVLRVYADVLVLTTVHWPDEVRKPQFDFLQEDPPQIRSQEFTMASALIDSMTEPVFDPSKYHDSYRAALESVIEEKVAGKKAKIAPKDKSSAEVTDLMSVLKASVSAAKDHQPGKSRTGTRSRKATGTSGKPTTGEKTTGEKTKDKPASPRRRSKGA